MCPYIFYGGERMVESFNVIVYFYNGYLKHGEKDRYNYTNIEHVYVDVEHEWLMLTWYDDARLKHDICLNMKNIMAYEVHSVMEEENNESEN